MSDQFILDYDKIENPYLEIPEILQGKIFVEIFEPEVFDSFSQFTVFGHESYKTGSIRIADQRGSLKCFFLTGTWHEWQNQGGFPTQAVTDGIDFAMIVTANTMKEASEKIRQMLQAPWYPELKKEFTLKPALLQLIPQKRGSSQTEDPKREAILWTPLLYDWLKSEILDKTPRTRYPEVNALLESSELAKSTWKSHSTAKKLAYRLVTREWPEVGAKFATFDKHYLSNPHKHQVLFVHAEVGWTAAANKFLHGGEHLLWFLYYVRKDKSCGKDNIEILVIKRPDSNRIFNEDLFRRNPQNTPLECSFEAYTAGEFEVRELVCKKEKGCYYWYDKD